MTVADQPALATGGRVTRPMLPTYEGQPKQNDWHACSAYESGFGGAKFGGKSLALLMESTRYTHHPAYRGILFRRTYPELTELMDRAWAWFPRVGGSWSGDNKTWSFRNGAKVLMRHCQHEESKQAYQGHEYHFMGFDQLEQFSEGQYTFLLAQNRSGVPDLVPYTRSTFNPGGIGHGWVKSRFIDHGTTGCPPWKPLDDASRQLPSRCFHFATIDDNPAGEHADPTYRARLLNLSEEEQRGLLHGDWDVFAGQFFGEWRRGLHVRDAFTIPPHWTARGWSVDWGYGAPWSVHFWVRDEDLYRLLNIERWIAYREFYDKGVQDVDQAARIKAAIAADNEAQRPHEVTHGKLRWSAVADPSIWNKKPGGGQSVAQIYQGAPYHLQFSPANNDRHNGWARMRGYMATHRALPDLTRVAIAPDGMPLLQFVREHCPHAVRTIPALVFDKTDKEDIQQGPEVEDHAADEVRYWLMSRSALRLDALLAPVPFEYGNWFVKRDAPPAAPQLPPNFPRRDDDQRLPWEWGPRKRPPSQPVPTLESLHANAELAQQLLDELKRNS